MSGGALLVLSLAVPTAGALVVRLLDRWPNVREAATLVTAGGLFAVVLRIWEAVTAGAPPRVTLVETIPGIPLALEAEPLGVLFALVASFLWIVTSVYSIGYMRGHHEENQTRFYLFFALALASAMGVAFAANLFTLFVFYEVLTLSTFPLVTHHGTEEAKRAGRVYLGILIGTSIGLQLLAIVWTWALTGTLDFRAGGILSGAASPGAVAVLLALYVFGIGKAAVMPFHRWLPAAMVAPTPVSALLHAVAVVKAGVFAVLKVVVYVFGIDLLTELGSSTWLMYVAGATILLASLVAFTKDNLKARLAYSTISQLSYIVLGAVLANAAGIIGGGMHIAMHAFGKITLFFGAGAIMVASHKTEISEMRGLGRTMPFTFLAFLVGTLSIIGVPPAGGLWSKWYLGLGALEAGQLALLATLMISSLLNIGYLLVIPIRAFFLPPDEPPEHDGIHEAPLPTLIAMGITAAGTIFLFLRPEPFYRLMAMVVGS
ncbi:MAG: monovalent cation/H+ antiporter subunit D family protein [Gemmatimonadetes bacterium]|nr:monovalent cation/H+ antiporter subunit D family protein [Gemmatimonadota bacterium]NIR79823.1 monovalent cation/H+ antiporter subunit D family protein [Gemmatimonadota bacterium]NIT88529.1 monovalent cation/H+ antiporter subunit D family protein [Gemmatimonadota bacterium]NIU32352.1 monovalent cation/H+ antiporter subunit D family protein [Gemmatimonadota bacterium]NIU36866.1 monovalent cation/H+ antiporter subunit D family protein [Gemmatimonadota bacterium]